MNKVIIAVVFAGLAFMVALAFMIPSVNPQYFSLIVIGVSVFMVYISKYANRAGLVKRVRNK